MSDSEKLQQLAAQATETEKSMAEALRRLRMASAAERLKIEGEIDRLHSRKSAISEEAATITVRQMEEQQRKASVNADPDGPRLDMGNLVRALDQTLRWRRDESCYLDNGVRKLPTLRVVAAWDDGSFIHFVIHVLAGEEEGFLGYCYEDDPSRWSWRVTDVEAQEVNLLSDQWFYGENLVPKIEGAAESEIRWQEPVPDTSLPVSITELRAMNLGTSARTTTGYFL